MPMTTEETEEVRKLLGQMEKRARGWKIARWILLALSICLIAFAFWVLSFTIGVEQRSLADLFPESQPTARPSGLDVRATIISVRLHFMMMAYALVKFMLGMWLFGFVTGSWGSCKRDVLYAKVLRCCLERSAPEPHKP